MSSWVKINEPISESKVKPLTPLPKVSTNMVCGHKWHNLQPPAQFRAAKRLFAEVTVFTVTIRAA